MIKDLKRMSAKLIESFVEKTKNLLQENLDGQCSLVNIGDEKLHQLFIEKSDLKTSQIISNLQDRTAIESEAPFDIATSFATQFDDLKTAIENVNSLLRPNGVFCFSIVIHNRSLNDLCNELNEKYPAYKDKIDNCLNALGDGEKLCEELPKILSECGFSIDYSESMAISNGDDLKGNFNSYLTLKRITI